MRKILFFLFFVSFAVFAKAQFGYYSNSNVLKALPTYGQAAAEYESLCSRCEKEIEHNERELTRKYVAFLDGYRDFPEPILRKRQNELQRLVDNSIAFRKELKAWLVQAKDSLFAPSREILAVALEKVCVACNIDYAIDVDVVAYAYINPNKAVDITRMLLDAALNPEKPVTALDGYDECLKFFHKDAEPVIGSDAVKSVEETILIPETEAATTEDVVDGAVVTGEAGNVKETGSVEVVEDVTVENGAMN